MIVQHSSISNEWYTPSSVLALVHAVLGDIDLDPASDAFGNSRVCAARYLSEADNSLTSVWSGNDPVSIYLNPPGGKTGKKSNTVLFWQRLLQERAMGGVKHAIFMCFSSEALQTTQDKGWPGVGRFPLCVPSRRIRFDAPGGCSGTAPSHSNAIVYVPGTIDRTARFVDVFGSIGYVMVPA